MSAANATPADDLDVLAPDRQIVVGGETLTVRELRFGEQLAHHATLAALADALRPAVESPGADGLTVILDALARHADGIMPIVALSCGKSTEWVSALSGEEGEALLAAFWTANRGFFMRRLLRAAIMQQAFAAAGRTSSPSSSGMDTPPAN